MKTFIWAFFLCALDFGDPDFAAAQTTTTNSIITWDSFKEDLFLTDNAQDSVIDPVSRQPGFYASALQAARKSTENLPANKDPEGHWGTSTNDFQLSLRFSNHTYTNNEPITAIVILRNVSTETLRWMQDWNHEKFRFVIDGPSGLQTTTKPQVPILITSGPTWLTVRPKTQRRFEFDLRQKLDLQSPGKYSIQVQTEALGTNASAFSVVSSGQATIEMSTPVKSSSEHQK